MEAGNLIYKQTQASGVWRNPQITAHNSSKNKRNIQAMSFILFSIQRWWEFSKIGH